MMTVKNCYGQWKENRQSLWWVP
jgi:hypothetical protein